MKKKGILERLKDGPVLGDGGYLLELEKRGWVEMRAGGSHRHFKHPERASVITVPGNEGKELAPGTLNDILKKAGLK